MNYKSVFFCGRAGSGKTYSAKYLQENYGYKSAKFAYPVYNLAYNYFDMQGKDRKLLQIIGTDAGRLKIDKNIWINRFQQDIRIIRETEKILGKSEQPLVLDDCRFLNEFQILKELGWVGFYLDVPDHKRLKRLEKRDGDAQIETLTHSSEIELISFKDNLIKIDSSGTLEETYAQIENAVEKYVRLL